MGPGECDNMEGRKCWLQIRIRRIAYDGETMWEMGIDPCTGPGKRAADIQGQDI